MCSIKTDEWRSGLHGLVSQHSNTLITVLIRTILGTFQSTRNVDDELNSICPDCLSRIEDCDWQRIAAQRCESELYELLVRTEKRSTDDAAAEIVKASGSAEMASGINNEQLPATGLLSDMDDKTNVPATSDQSTKAKETTTDPEQLDRFYEEHYDDIEDEFDDFDYDIDGDEDDIDGMAFNEEDDPDLPYYVERRSSDEDYYDEEDDELYDEDWDGGKTAVERTPVLPKGKIGRPRNLPVEKKAKGKVGRPKSRPDKIPKPLGRPRIHPLVERRPAGRPSERKSYECKQCDQVFTKNMQFQVIFAGLLCQNSIQFQKFNKFLLICL